MTRRKAPEQREGAQSADTLPALPTPSAAIATPPPPHHLDAHAAAVWVRVYEAGGGAYVPATDPWAIERYAELQSRRRRLERMIEEEGITVRGSQDQIVQHPAARLLHQTEQQLLPLEDRLGLNPQARLNLGLQLTDLRSGLDKFAETDAADF